MCFQSYDWRTSTACGLAVSLVLTDSLLYYSSLFVLRGLETSLGERSFRALMPSSLALLNVKCLMMVFFPPKGHSGHSPLLLILHWSYSAVNAALLKVVPTFPLTHFLGIYTLAVKILSQMKLEKQDLSMMAFFFPLFLFFLKHSSDFRNIWNSF